MCCTKRTEKKEKKKNGNVPRGAEQKKNFICLPLVGLKTRFEKTYCWMLEETLSVGPHRDCMCRSSHFFSNFTYFYSSTSCSLCRMHPFQDYNILNPRAIYAIAQATSRHVCLFVLVDAPGATWPRGVLLFFEECP